MPSSYETTDKPHNLVGFQENWTTHGLARDAGICLSIGRGTEVVERAGLEMAEGWHLPFGPF